MELSSKVAVVTGSSSGIGYYTAKVLLEKGAIVYGLSRRTTSIAHSRFRWIKADLGHAEEIDAAFSRIREDDPVISVLINNAGVGVFGEIETIDPETWHQVIAVNLTAAFLCTRQVVPDMKRRQCGMIVNIASIAAKRGFKGGTAYCASKFAMAGFSESLMEELREHGIRVSCICPGSVETEFFRNTGLHPAKLMKPEEVARIIVSTVEMPEGILPDQIVLRPL